MIKWKNRREKGGTPIRYLDISPLGDNSMIIRLGEQADEETHKKVRAVSECLSLHPFDGMVEVIPAFTSVAVVYDPARMFLQRDITGSHSEIRYPFERVRDMLQRIMEQLSETADRKSRLVEIPVCYGGAYGPDLDQVAEINRLTPEEVVHIHSSSEYLVYLIGFAPGFPYLGGMDPRIAAPRRQTPRLAVPSGSVGIAGEQTGVYPLESPGGWQLIGRTPISLFVPDQSPPVLVEAGDVIRFYPISRQTFEEWGEGI
ncbi:5-oxoprolinase subunit PxpB [Paenibacillus thalictri]|uniref:5-oxoprolinase subunit PxpB n=1 Tax=Paenibacillus thalictri TaxID=2527873 RepID=A0A4V6MSH1_9BACL|nr:5-oxoprolinase subunit PxpB [Paenibacillus thalictri]TBL78681.1 5-oxoprolinase subunit PxpB [Paenibacillus thalictri]